MRAASFRPCRAFVCGCLIFAAGSLLPRLLPAAEPGAGQAPPLLVTNLVELRRIAAQKTDVGHTIRLEGNLWWANVPQGRIVLQDDTAAEELELDLTGQNLSPGERVRIEGNGTITRSAGGFKIGIKGAVVDNNGVHSMVRKSGAAYLTKGRQPIRVEWFNGVEKFALEVDYEGPGIPRQQIPASSLFPTAAGSGTNFGLYYRTYPVQGEVLPDFTQLTTLESGTVSGFDVSVAGGKEHIGVAFSGFLEVPEDGLYTFYTTSDDGSRLYVGQSRWRFQKLGRMDFPQPRALSIWQTLGNGDDGQWAEVQGKVCLIQKQENGTCLELSAGSGRLRVEISGGADLPSGLALNSRIRAIGFCQPASMVDGENVPGILFVPGGRQIEILEVPPKVLEQADTGPGRLPVLNFASEVHHLKREEAARRYPVKIRGVITSVLPEHQAFTLQDGTRGIYIEDHSQSRSDPPRVGEFLEVEGATDTMFFAPIVNAQQVRCLRAGRLPDPVQPTWDQLMNGSLDAQFVEIQGIVTAVLTNGVSLRTRGGVINVQLRLNGAPGDLQACENALVRLRGCLLASWDYSTHQVMVGEIKIYNADLIVDQPPPRDLFSSPAKSPAELLQFDPQAGVFERVKVAGQIVYAREPEYFLMQGSHGLRVSAKFPADLHVGDLVEMVGFSELSPNGFPILSEAVARKTGTAALPQPEPVRAADLLRTRHNSTRVRVEGVLASARKSGTDQVLEMQSGVRSFVARWNGSIPPGPTLDIGSRLELVGLYVGQGGNRAAGENFASFELLLGSPADIHVLARPPWWTLQRLLIILGALACVLAATMLWITQLHRQVEERTAQLGEQIRERQRVENQRAMEQERARIAQDLHDELGSGITEITMLATRADSPSLSSEKRTRYLEQAGDKAREMVAALDEIVWAMNPGHNSLASLVSYFSLYADRFLGLANIAWRLEAPADLSDCVMDSRHRHQLFLVFKEALTNVVRHAKATQVRLGFHVKEGQLLLSIADNGRGFPSEARTDDMSGVTNMRARVEKLGGRFELTSDAKKGTLLVFSVPSG